MAAIIVLAIAALCGARRSRGFPLLEVGDSIDDPDTHALGLVGLDGPWGKRQAQPSTARVVTATPVPSGPGMGYGFVGDGRTGGGISTWTVVVPVAILGVAAIIGSTCWFLYRRKHRNDPPVTATTRSWAVGQRRRAYLSRQDDGGSVRSLPLYSAEAAGSEVVLQRQNTNAEEDYARRLASGSPTPTTSAESIHSAEDEGQVSRIRNNRDSVPSYLEATSPTPSGRPSLDIAAPSSPEPAVTTTTTTTSNNALGLRRFMSRTLLRQAERPLDAEAGPPQDTTPEMAQVSNTTPATTSVPRAMADVSDQVRPGNSRRTTDSLNSHTMLLHASSSRRSTSSISTTTDAETSTSPIHQHATGISSSSPLNAAVPLDRTASNSTAGSESDSRSGVGSTSRTSYIAPRKGLTEDQKRFLASQGVVDVSTGAAGRASISSVGTASGRRDNDEEERDEDEAPPTFEQSTATTAGRQSSSRQDDARESMSLGRLPAPEIEIHLATPASERSAM